MMLKVGAALLMFWGLLNAVGGYAGARQHPAPWIGPAYGLVGLVIVAGGVAFWRARRSALPVALAGLVALSVLALVSGSILHPGQGIRISHHVERLAISAVFLGVALLGRRRADDA